MQDWVVANEIALRVGIFLGLLGLMAGTEAVCPRRSRALPRGRRWTVNLGLMVAGAVVVRLIVPVTAVGIAAIAAERSWGLLNAAATAPWIAVSLAVVVLDLAIYGQHVAFHRVPALWRLHRVHHCDVEFDVTTGIRFHPGELVLSMLYKLAVIVALGAPPAAVVLFEILLSGGSLFTHANLRLPAGIDRRLRMAFVTPDMHRVHHSVYRDESDSNYGFNLSVWDRLFGTYRAQPRDGHDAMDIGLERFRGAETRDLGQLLLLPMRSG